MTRLALLLMLALGTGCAASAPAAPRLAEQVATNARTVLAAYDLDGDGRLDRREAGRLALKGDTFAALDRDGDGRLDGAEFLAPARLATLETAFRELTDRWLALSDADGDGRLSRAEYDQATLGPRPGAGARAVPGGPAAAFLAADLDGDGALARGEALALVGWLLERGWRLAPRG